MLQEFTPTSQFFSWLFVLFSLPVLKKIYKNYAVKINDKSITVKVNELTVAGDALVVCVIGCRCVCMVVPD